MAYTKTAAVTANVTTVQAEHHNSMMAELKAAAEGIPTHDVDIAIAYTGNNINTVTYTDASPAGDAGYDITAVATFTYTGSRVTTIATVFNAGEMNFTMTEVLGYTGDQLTSVGRTIS